MSAENKIKELGLIDAGAGDARGVDGRDAAGGIGGGTGVAAMSARVAITAMSARGALGQSRLHERTRPAWSR